MFIHVYLVTVFYQEMNSFENSTETSFLCSTLILNNWIKRNQVRIVESFTVEFIFK